jgi:hypothetical protein
LYFNHNQAVKAYHAAKRLTDQADGLVYDLACLLMITMLAKLNQQDEIAFHYKMTNNKFLAPFFSALVSDESHVTEEALNILPLRSEDRILFL